MRVLAVEQMQALPYATQLMAHLGAEVVKVEPPQRGDAGRASQPSLVDDDGRRVGATYLRNNLSKHSIAIDLKHADGRALFARLVPHFDVVAENMRPGAMHALGLGYDAIAKLSPRTIYVSISGFGSDGASPYASWPAYAPVAEAMGGLYEPSRKPDQPPPVVVAGALGDIGSALFAVIGILAALRERERSGLGQQVDVAMFDSMIALSDMPPLLWSMGAPERWAAAGSLGVCAAFRARDGHFVVAVFREHQFERLAHAVGHPEWPKDPRFATREGWAQHTDSEIRPALERWARDKTKLEASRELCAAGIVAGPSNTAADLRGRPARRGARHADRGAAPRRRAAAARGREPDQAVAHGRGARPALPRARRAHRRRAARGSRPLGRGDRGSARARSDPMTGEPWRRRSASSCIRRTPR